MYLIHCHLENYNFCLWWLYNYTNFSQNHKLTFLLLYKKDFNMSNAKKREFIKPQCKIRYGSMGTDNWNSSFELCKTSIQNYNRLYFERIDKKIPNFKTETLYFITKHSRYIFNRHKLPQYYATKYYVSLLRNYFFML